MDVFIDAASSFARNQPIVFSAGAVTAFATYAVALKRNPKVVTAISAIGVGLLAFRPSEPSSYSEVVLPCPSNRERLADRLMGDDVGYFEQFIKAIPSTIDTVSAHCEEGRLLSCRKEQAIQACIDNNSTPSALACVLRKLFDYLPGASFASEHMEMNIVSLKSRCRKGDVDSCIDLDLLNSCFGVHATSARKYFQDLASGLFPENPSVQIPENPIAKPFELLNSFGAQASNAKEYFQDLASGLFPEQNPSVQILEHSPTEQISENPIAKPFGLLNSFGAQASNAKEYFQDLASGLFPEQNPSAQILEHSPTEQISENPIAKPFGLLNSFGAQASNAKEYFQDLASGLFPEQNPSAQISEQGPTEKFFQVIKKPWGV